VEYPFERLELRALLQFKISTKRNEASKQFQLISSASFIFTKIHRYAVHICISKLYIGVCDFLIFGHV
jgi:hypothetical protein